MSMLVGIVYANPQILQIELEHSIRKCTLEKYKSLYTLLETEYTSTEEKIASLASCERVAQETKQYKLIKLAKLEPYIIKKGSSAAYFAMQGSFAYLFASLGGGIYGEVLGFATKTGDISDKRRFAIGSFMCLVAGTFGYYAKKNYTKAFRADVLLTRDIQVLDEILACIHNAQTNAVPVNKGTMAA